MAYPRVVLLSFLTLLAACNMGKTSTEVRKENPPAPPVAVRELPKAPSPKTQSPTQGEASAQWEEEEAKKVKQFAPQDHQECTAKGYFIGKPEDPKTEAYHDCRAHLAEQRVAPPHAGTGHTPGHLPKAVLAIRHQADLARHAFDGRDYQDHLTCMDKGFFPGKFYEPQTEKYFSCRANFARSGLGNVVADIFEEDAARARYEAKEYATCTGMGYPYGTGDYTTCRRAYGTYVSCRKTIPMQLQTRLDRDRADCNQKARLELPSKLAQSSEQLVTHASTEERRTRYTIPARYTPAELDRARAGTAAICMNERETARDEYRLQREYTCEKIMATLPPPARR